MKISLLLFFIVTTRARIPSIPLKNVSNGTKVVGGDEARLGDLPYTAVLQYAGASVDRLCTAAIIDEQWLVTAATCFYDKNIEDPSSFAVKAGKRSLEEVEASEQARKISKIIINENYNAISGANNIALLKLSSKFTFDTFVSAIRIDHHMFPFGNCTVSGWGSFADSADKDLLHKAIVSVRKEATCELYFPGKILPGTFCAGSEYTYISPCEEDLGGPLACADSTSQHLSGVVVAMNDACNKPYFSGAPAMYTDVSYYAKWIEDTMDAYSRATTLSLSLITVMVVCSMMTWDSIWIYL